MFPPKLPETGTHRLSLVIYDCGKTDTMALLKEFQHFQRGEGGGDICETNYFSNPYFATSNLVVLKGSVIFSPKERDPV